MNAIMSRAQPTGILGQPIILTEKSTADYGKDHTLSTRLGVLF